MLDALLKILILANYFSRKQSLKSLLLIFVLLNSCIFCSKKSGSNVINTNPTSFQDSSSIADSSVPRIKVTPIFGHRFQLIGDYDGDGQRDTLTEHFYSFRDKKETNKYYLGIDNFWGWVDSANEKNCYSFFLGNRPFFDTIPIHGIFGPLWLKNEGDLDGDGADEISFVESLPQQSSMNHCQIVSFKNGKWKEIYRFSVREWQFPPLPQGGSTYGLFGKHSSYSIANRDSIDKILQKQFDEFPGLITKMPSGKVKIQTFTDQMDDTMLYIDLSKNPKIYN